MSYKNDSSYLDLNAGLPVAQGDLLILKMKENFSFPWNFTEIQPDRKDGNFTAAHSETGHHHVLRGMIPFDMSGAMEGGGGSSLATRLKLGAPATVKATVRMFRDKTSTDSELRSYVIVEGDDAMVEHHRGFHTHATVYLPVGTYLFARQFRPTPEGLKKVQD